MKKNFVILLASIWLSQILTSCVTTAGSPCIYCYSRLYKSENQLKKTFEEFWKRYHENRLNSNEIIEIRKYYPLMFDGLLFKDPLSSDSLYYAFERQINTKDCNKREWYLKSTNGKLVFCFDISNCGLIVKKCDICLIDVLFMDNIENNFMNLKLSAKDRRYAKELFERDIIQKMQKLKN